MRVGKSTLNRVIPFLGLLLISSCAKTLENGRETRQSDAETPSSQDAANGPFSRDHGFGSLSLLTAEAAAKQGSSIDKEIYANQSLIFTGDALRLDDSCRLDLPAGSVFLSDVWTQRLLLEIFDHGLGWFRSALDSLQEAGPQGNSFRPSVAVHPDLVKRLNKGTNPNYWVLNGVRFRFFGEDTVQIKLNYELDVKAAGVLALSDGLISIASASMIHSLAVYPSFVEELKEDVRKLGINPTLTGCRLLTLLNKYVASTGSSARLGARVSYNFLHTNIFDLSPGIVEWRFTEHRVVLGDSKPFSETSAKLPNPMLEQMAPVSFCNTAVGVTTGEFPTSESMPMATAGNICPTPTPNPESTPKRLISKPLDNPMTNEDADRRLRIIPMEFPRYYTKGNSGDIELAQDLAPFTIWFSGTRSDVGENMSASRRIDLLYDPVTKNPIPFETRHLAFQHDQVLTCAECHSRRDRATHSSNSELLDEAPAMQFRHIGFGDGSNSQASCNALWGVPRANLRASLSIFLLTQANGFDLYGTSKNFTGPVNPLPETMCAGGKCPTKLDPIRCIIMK